MIQHRTLQELEAELDHIRRAGRVAGTVVLIVRRPETGQREVLESCELSLDEGLVGDNWKRRGNRKTPDGSAHPDTQINLMNVRVIDALAPDKADWPLAGDQFYIDMNLSKEMLPAGSRLRIGTAVLEITAEPHLGCRKFAERFGKDAVQFVNSDLGKQLNLRGVNARVVVPGQVNTGDMVLNMHRASQLAAANQTTDTTPGGPVIMRAVAGRDAEAAQPAIPVNDPAKPFCSFCGNIPEVVNEVLAGPGVFICKPCALKAAGQDQQ